MTKIIIHGQKMQFHKKIAISVTLTSGTGGTATFTPATGTSYTLSSLPIGSKIVKVSGSLYNITDSSSTVLGSITLTESSGYTVGTVTVGQTVISSSPYILSDGDVITAEFVAIPKATVYFGNDGYGEFIDPNTGDTITQLEVDDTYLRFGYDGTYVTVSNLLESTGLWSQVATGKPLAKEPSLYGVSPTGQGVSSALVSGMPNIQFPDAWALPSGNLNNSGFHLLEVESPLVTIAYSEFGDKIEWDEDNNLFILTNSSGNTITMADTDYGLPPFKNLGIADAPGYSSTIETGLYNAMLQYGPLAYVPGWDTGLSKIDDMQPGQTYYDINSTHTLKNWSDIGGAALSTSEYNFLQTMQFNMINMWYDAEGNRFGQPSDLMLCLNISPRTYSIELRGELMHGEPVKSLALQSYTVTYIPSDYYYNGNVMCQINNGSISIRNIQASIDTDRYTLDCPGRIRLRG